MPHPRYGSPTGSPIALLQLLQLLQLADSAVPIGGGAHSFGLETLVEDGALPPDGLYDFLRDFVEEAGVVEAAFGREGHRLGSVWGGGSAARWLSLNRRLAAWKPARESRAASATLGRRFLELALALEAAGECPAGVEGWEGEPCPEGTGEPTVQDPGAANGSRPEGTRASPSQADLNSPAGCLRSDAILRGALEAARRASAVVHHAAAFGLVGGALGLEEEAMVAAYLQQMVAALISAAQRLMPLGQTQASRLLWDLKPALLEAAAASRDLDAFAGDLASFTSMIEMASMRHPALATRLFIS